MAISDPTHPYPPTAPQDKKQHKRHRRFSGVWDKQDKAWGSSETAHQERVGSIPEGSRSTPETSGLDHVGTVDIDRIFAQNSDGYIDEGLIQAEGEDRVTLYLVFLVLTAAIAGFLFGFDTALIGNAVPIIGDDLGHILSSTEIELITALLTVGAIFGSAILGALADKLGRKWAMAIADLFFTAGSIIIAASYSVPQMIIGRVVLGVGVGGAAVIAPLFLAEVAPTKMRGRSLGINACCIPIGQVVASGLGAGLQNTPHGWRILFAIGVVPSTLQLFLMHWLPESPRVMILRGQRDRALQVMARIYPAASDETLQLKLQLAEAYVKATRKLKDQLSLRERVVKLWSHKPYRRAILCVSGVQVFGQLTAFNTLLYYSGTLFGLLGISSPAVAGLIPACLNALFAISGMTLVDKIGRRRLFLFAIPTMIAGLVWITVAMHFLVRVTDNRLVQGYPYDSTLAGLVIGGIVLFTIGFGSGYSFLAWFQSELLSLEIRSAGSAIATVSCWVANLIVSVAYLTQLETLTPPGTYAMYVAFSTIGWVFVVFCYPEANGLSVDEASALFVDDFGIRKSERLRKKKRRIREEMQATQSERVARA